MKAIVENPVPNPCLYALFITIINDITTSYTEEQLRKICVQQCLFTTDFLNMLIMDSAITTCGYQTVKQVSV